MRVKISNVRSSRSALRTHPSFYSVSLGSTPRGACYFTTENNNCPQGSVLSTSTRNNNIKTWAAQITAAGLPWLYWQVLPNNDPHVRVVSSLVEGRWIADFLILLCGL